VFHTASRTNCTFGFCRHTANAKKPKEQFFANAQKRTEETEEQK